MRTPSLSWRESFLGPWRRDLLLVLSGTFFGVALVMLLERDWPATIATVTTAASPAVVEEPVDEIAAKRLLFPLAGIDPRALRDNFLDKRGARTHHALDIMAPRGTPVLAVDDGRVARIYRNALGGRTLYLLDATERYVYYYAHLDRYAEGLAEGASVRRGDVIAYVGSTGNAPAHAPHLHFTIFRVAQKRQWWKGDAINPYPYFAARGPG